MGSSAQSAAIAFHASFASLSCIDYLKVLKLQVDIAIARARYLVPDGHGMQHLQVWE
jgi:hypothetical protein